MVLLDFNGAGVEGGQEGFSEGELGHFAGPFFRLAEKEMRETDQSVKDNLC